MINPTKNPHQVELIDAPTPQVDTKSGLHLDVARQKARASANVLPTVGERGVTAISCVANGVVIEVETSDKKYSYFVPYSNVKAVF